MYIHDKYVIHDCAVWGAGARKNESMPCNFSLNQKTHLQTHSLTHIISYTGTHTRTHTHYLLHRHTQTHTHAHLVAYLSKNRVIYSSFCSRVLFSAPFCCYSFAFSPHFLKLFFPTRKFPVRKCI